MGITIHFKATIDPVRIPELVAEVKSIATHYGWTYTTVRDGEIDEHVAEPEPEEEPSPEEQKNAYHITDPIPLSGIIVRPGEGCEALSLLFDKDGQSSDLITWLLVRDGDIRPEEAWTSVKTQFTKLETHVAIAELLKYLKKHFLKTLEVEDEGQYYDTGDIEQLHRLKARVGRWIAKLAEGLSKAGEPSEAERLDPEALADRIEQIVRDLWERERPS